MREDRYAIPVTVNAIKFSNIPRFSRMIGGRYIRYINKSFRYYVMEQLISSVTADQKFLGSIPGLVEG